MNYCCCCCCCCRCCYETEWPPPEWRSPEDDERRMEWRHSPRNTSSSSPSETPQNRPSQKETKKSLNHKETKTTDQDDEEEHSYSYYSYSHKEETSERPERRPFSSPWPPSKKHKPSEARAPPMKPSEVRTLENEKGRGKGHTKQGGKPFPKCHGVLPRCRQPGAPFLLPILSVGPAPRGACLPALYIMGATSGPTSWEKVTLPRREQDGET